MNSAIEVSCDLNYMEFKGDVTTKDLFRNNKVLNNGDVIQLELGVPREAIHSVEILYYDLLENPYKQLVELDTTGGGISCQAKTPEIVS